MVQYVHTDECLDVLASLEHCVLSLTRAPTSNGAWKWVVLSFHSALQGAMVCHLSGTAQLGALTRSNAAKWLEWHDRDRSGQIRRVRQGFDELGTPIERTEKEEGQPPSDYVANASELFDRLTGASTRIESGCGGIIRSRQYNERRLNDCTDCVTSSLTSVRRVGASKCNSLVNPSTGSLMFCA